jgi:hypothetical protein
MAGRLLIPGNELIQVKEVPRVLTNEHANSNDCGTKATLRKESVVRESLSRAESFPCSGYLHVLPPFYRLEQNHDLFRDTLVILAQLVRVIATLGIFRKRKADPELDITQNTEVDDQRKYQ